MNAKHPLLGRPGLCAGAVLPVLLFSCWVAKGQELAGRAVAADGEATVALNFPQEIPVEALVDYVSERLGIKILYDETIADKKINIKAPGEIPVASLLGVLESALKIKGLMLVDAEVEGWKHIVTVEDLPSVAPAGDAEEAIEKYGRGTAITQAFVLEQADPEQVGEIIKPFLTPTGANTVAVPETGTLIVTDYATNLLKIARWINFIDHPRPQVKVEFIPLEHVQAAEVSAQVTSILTAKTKTEGAREIQPQVELIDDERGNQILLVGPKKQVEEARELIRSLDTPLGLITETYGFTNVSAATIDQVARHLIGEEADERFYRSFVDEDANQLIIIATEEFHGLIKHLKTTRDIPPDQVASPIRFYKVKNLPVMELLETIRAVEAGAERPPLSGANWRQLQTDGRIRPARERPVPGPNRLPGRVEGELPTPPAVKESEPAVVEPDVPGEAPGTPGVEMFESAQAAQLLGRARVSADIHTNTLIVVAEPSVQRLYGELIEELDRRRPQVLIEAKFVIIDASDDFSFGVEVSGGDREGASRLFAFTSYGLSTVNPATGALSLIPGLGFNGALVNPEVADAVLRAVSNHSRARVTSSPRILVNDNATGQLTSVAEVPFTSINASETVATTSFAGFAEAGTTITVTPRISDENHLQLDFAITVNSFTGGGSENVPPPRQTEEVTSQITIPDGFTVIVGGLNRGNRTYTYQGVPFIDQVPVLRKIFALTTTSDSRSSMFIFIRPVILREDKFRDLRFLSRRDLCEARLPGNFPASEPLWIE